MESFSVETERGMVDTPRTKRKGGLITVPFIIANEALENVGTYGILPTMILYLMYDYSISALKAINMLFLWSAATNFTPVVGAFLADSYLGRFLTIALGSIFSLMGMTLLWLTAMISKLRPPPCNPLTPPCQPATSSQYGVLVTAFALLSVGAGGIRSSSVAFGADQFGAGHDNPNGYNAKSERAFETFFSWYNVAGSASILLAVTVFVYLQDHLGWKVGFGILACLLFLSAFLFVVAYPFYVKRSVSRSIFTGFVQVIVVAFKNRKLALPSPSDTVAYHSQPGSNYSVPTDRLRFLNKACIIRNPEDVTSDGVAANPWNLCTVEQVEELKILVRILPLWSTSIIISIFTIQTFPVLQARTMDRHLNSGFQIPSGTFGLLIVISVIVWIPIYDRIIIPLASKIRGKPVSISAKNRMGIGLFMACIGLGISGIVEHIRLKKAINAGLLNNPQGVIHMSAMWLFPQSFLYGIAISFNTVGQYEFFYTECPKSMSSIASSLYQLGMAVSNLLASVLLSLVDKYTKGKGVGNESWVPNDINKGHIDYYYWLLGILNVINFVYFILCSWAYGPGVDNTNKKAIEENQLGESSFRSATATTRVFPDASFSDVDE